MGIANDMMEAVHDAQDTARRAIEQRDEAYSVLANLIGKLEVMNGCNEHDLDAGGPEEMPEIAAARTLLARVTKE